MNVRKKSFVKIKKFTTSPSHHEVIVYNYYTLLYNIKEILIFLTILNRRFSYNFFYK